MMSKCIDVSDNNFKEIFLNNEKISVIYFWADWCNICINITPIIDELSEEYDNKNINFYKFKIEPNSNVPNEFEIKALPSILIIKDFESNIIFGSISKEKIKTNIEKYF